MLVKRPGKPSEICATPGFLRRASSRADIQVIPNGITLLGGVLLQTNGAPMAEEWEGWRLRCRWQLPRLWAPERGSIKAFSGPFVQRLATYFKHWSSAQC